MSGNPVRAVRRDRKLSRQAERRESRLSEAARSLILSRDSKVVDAWIIRRAEGLAREDSSENDSKSGKQRDERRKACRYRANCAVVPFKNQQ